VQRAASMATMFYLASLCFYIKSRLPSVVTRAASSGVIAKTNSSSVFAKTNSSGVIARSEATKQSFKNIYYLLALLSTVAAMYTKEFTITLPLTILLYEFSFLRTSKFLNLKPVIPFLLTILIIPSTMLLTRSVDIHGLHRATEELPGISPQHYLLTQFRVMATYIRLLFLPLHQNVDYDYPVTQSLFELPSLISFLFLGAILFFAQRLFSKYRILSFSILWFFLTLLPESSIFPIKDVIFEHRLYLPLAGYSIFLVSGAYYLLGEKNIRAMVVVLTMLIACNSILTYERNKIWKDEFTLWGDAVQRSPHKARVYSHLGTAYCQGGDLKQCLKDYNKSLELDPNDVQTINDRGDAYAKQNDLTRALADFNKVIRSTPRFAQPYYNRGLIFSMQGDYRRSVADYSKAIENSPNYACAYNNRAVAYYQLKEFDNAWDDLHKAENLGYEVNPGFINALKQATGRDN